MRVHTSYSNHLLGGFFYNSHLKKRNQNGILMQTHWGKNTYKSANFTTIFQGIRFILCFIYLFFSLSKIQSTLQCKIEPSNYQGIEHAHSHDDSHYSTLYHCRMLSTFLWCIQVKCKKKQSNIYLRPAIAFNSISFLYRPGNLEKHTHTQHK